MRLSARDQRCRARAGSPFAQAVGPRSSILKSDGLITEVTAMVLSVGPMGGAGDGVAFLGGAGSCVFNIPRRNARSVPYQVGSKNERAVVYSFLFASWTRLLR